MPISIHFDPEQNVLFGKAAGVITSKDISAYYSKIEGLDFKPGYSILADCTEASPDLTYNDVARMAEKRSGLALETGLSKIAVVAKSDIVFGLARMYQGMLGGEHFEVNVFRNRWEALLWLGVSDV